MPKFLQGINDRLDHLEIAQNLDEIRSTLESTQQDFIDLRADQDVQQAAHNALLDRTAEYEKNITLAVADGIERVDRAERRVKATIASARKELERRGLEDPRLDAEAYELRDADGDGSASGGVPAVPSEVEPNNEAPSSVRGVPLELLRRVRGM